MIKPDLWLSSVFGDEGDISIGIGVDVPCAQDELSIFLLQNRCFLCQGVHNSVHTGSIFHELVIRVVFVALELPDKGLS